MIYLLIWLALGCASLLYIIITEDGVDELFTVEGILVSLVIILLGPLFGAFVSYLNFSMRDK